MGGQGNPAGPIALVGGAEWRPPAAGLDAWLLERSGSSLVTVVPTAARDHPAMAVATARRHFRGLGGDVQDAGVMSRADALDPAVRSRLASSRLLYLAGGDPGYLQSVLVGTPAWAGMLDALAAGAVLAGSSAGAMVLCDRMLRPGSGGTEPGLGLLEQVLVLPHHERWQRRLGQVAAVLGPGEDLRVLGIDECTGLVLEGDACRVMGAGSVTRYRVHPGGSLEAVWVHAGGSTPAGCLSPGRR